MGTKWKPINVNATEDIRRAWRIQAAVEGRSVSEMVRDVMGKYIKTQRGA